MEFKSLALPPESEGLSFKGIPSMTVPDQAMSLEEILERFTRDESLAIGKSVAYPEQEEVQDDSLDLEKLQYYDPVDKQAVIDKQKAVQAKYRRQEEKRQAEEKARQEADMRAKIEAETRAKVEAEKTGQQK